MTTTTSINECDFVVGAIDCEFYRVVHIISFNGSQPRSLYGRLNYMHRRDAIVIIISLFAAQIAFSLQKWTETLYWRRNKPRKKWILITKICRMERHIRVQTRAVSTSKCRIFLMILRCALLPFAFFGFSFISASKNEKRRKNKIKLSCILLRFELWGTVWITHTTQLINKCGIRSRWAIGYT